MPHIRYAHIGMSLQKGITIRIQREPMNSIPHGQDQNGGGRIQTISRRDHIRTPLQKHVHAIPLLSPLNALGHLINPEYRPHGQTRIDILRSIDRIEHRHVLRSVLVPQDWKIGIAHRIVSHDARRTPRLVLLLARHGDDRPVAPAAERAEHVGIAQHVELLLHLALHVLLELFPGGGIDRRSVEVVGGGTLDDAIDLFAGVGGGVEGPIHGFEVGEFPAFYLEETLEGSHVWFLFECKEGCRCDDGCADGRAGGCMSSSSNSGGCW
mmetsp:Transcript_29250/g.62979  ORF Transcript_29250/g.62979 Transcript_29250/m.62979 type:complete len:267 (-) Transcript_29250:166-966(-)